MAAASQRRPARTSHPPPPPPEAGPLPCPRCDSTSTKFCYYNNYNLSQPRHFCKGCRRYWTHGGTLRDVPIGGGSRKNAAKRCRTTTPSAAAADSTPPVTGDQVFGGGSFTSLLSGSGGDSAARDHGLFGLEDLGPGLKGHSDETIWPFGADTWHVGSGGEDCALAANYYYYMPELAISSIPSDFMK